MLGSVNLLAHCFDLTRTGNYIYCSLLDQGMQVVDVTNPAFPVISYANNVSKDVAPGIWWTDVEIVGTRAYAAGAKMESRGGLYVFDVTNPANP